jgi:hypothetical protein
LFPRSCSCKRKGGRVSTYYFSHPSPLQTTRKLNQEHTRPQQRNTLKQDQADLKATPTPRRSHRHPRTWPVMKPALARTADDESVLTQYLFHKRFSNRRSSADLKIVMSSL